MQQVDRHPLELPLIGFVTALCGALADAQTVGRGVAMMESGDLVIERGGDTAVVRVGDPSDSVQVPMADLALAVAEFRDRVFSTLEIEIPDLRRHPAWPTWVTACGDIGASSRDEP